MRLVARLTLIALFPACWKPPWFPGRPSYPCCPGGTQATLTAVTMAAIARMRSFLTRSSPSAHTFRRLHPMALPTHRPDGSASLYHPVMTSGPIAVPRDLLDRLGTPWDVTGMNHVYRCGVLLSDLAPPAVSNAGYETVELLNRPGSPVGSGILLTLAVVIA
jgi:hypothetical protein